MDGLLHDFQAYFVLASLIALFVVLAKSRSHPAKWMVGLAVGYYLVGLVSLEGFLTSYVNPAVITLMLLLVVGMVLEKTIWLNRLAEGLFKPSLRVTYAKMGLFVGLSSAFLNNTAIVASLLSAAKNNRFQLPSKVLIPLSYISILGGTLTLVGTSTHLLVNGLLVQAGFKPFELFDFIWVGLPVLMIGSLVIVLLAKFVFGGVDT
jgi:di/tricarboxylate transporter